MNTMQKQTVLIDNKEYEMIAKYKKDNKNFIVYTDKSFTNNKLNIYCGQYDDSIGQIQSITNQEDINFLENEINKLIQEVNNK